MKKFGFAGIGIIALWLLSVFFDRGSISSSLLTGNITELSGLLLPILTLAFAYHLLNDEEHQLCAYILCGVSFVTTAIILLGKLIDGNEAFFKIYELQTSLNTHVFLISSPFFFRSQSSFHAKYKKGLAIFIAVLVGFTLLFGLIGESLAKSGTGESLYKLMEFFGYATIFAVALSFANPMVGYITSGTVGAPLISRMPKLVPVQQVPTVPDNMANMTINQGINYGSMPVPDGVVSSTPAAPVAPVVPDQAAAQPVAETPAPAPASPQPAINVNEVAPELQFIMDNNKE